MSGVATRPSMKAMKNIAKPMIERGEDWQRIQWEILNEFDGLTNCDEDGEYIMDAIRECEDEATWHKGCSSA